MSRLTDVDRRLGVGDRLALGDLPDQPLAALGEGHHRRRGARPLAVGDHHRLAALHDRDAAVGGPEVDADDLPHARPTLRPRRRPEPPRPPPPSRGGATFRGAARHARAGQPPFPVRLPVPAPGQRLVQCRIEGLAHRAPGLDSVAGQCLLDLPEHQRTPSASGSDGAAAESARSRLSTAGRRSFTTGPAACRAASSRSRATRLRKLSRSAAVRSSLSCSATSSVSSRFTSSARSGTGASTSTEGSPEAGGRASPSCRATLFRASSSTEAGMSAAKLPFSPVPGMACSGSVACGVRLEYVTGVWLRARTAARKCSVRLGKGAPRRLLPTPVNCGLCRRGPGRSPGRSGPRAGSPGRNPSGSGR